MALIPCWECRKEISNSAATCPHCGAARRPASVSMEANNPKRRVWPWVVGVPLGLVVLFLAYGFSIPEYESSAHERRKICEMIAAPHQRYECDRIYHQDIAAGRAAAETAKRR